MLKGSFSFLCVIVLAGVLSGRAAIAEDMMLPKGEVLLQVRGAMEVSNVEGRAEFDLEMLKALPVTSFRTSTIWTQGEIEFSGVALVDLLEAVQAHGEVIHAIALNDYAIDIPVSDAVEGGPIIAYAMNGEAMSVRDKGPLWIVYPYDSSSEFRTETIYARSIWQLDRIWIE